MGQLGPVGVGWGLTGFGEALLFVLSKRGAHLGAFSVAFPRVRTKGPLPMLGTVRRRLTILDVLALLALVGAFALGALLWPSLPARVPIHFDANGLPNGFAPRSVGILLSPTLGAGAWLLIRFGIARFPVRDGVPLPSHSVHVGRVGEILGCALSLFFLAVHAATLRAAIHGQWPHSVMAVALGGLCVTLALVLPRVGRNAFVGVRTPWALASDENWTRTHRVASYTMAGAALGCFVAALVPLARGGAAALEIPIAVGSLLGAAIVPAIYSALIAHRSHP